MRDQLMTLNQLVQLMDPQLYLHLQKADSTNFFFLFRMLLVWYKREFEWGDVLRLWETLWTDYLSSSFHIFFAMAILEKHRDVIMDHLHHFDDVLKYSTYFSIWRGNMFGSDSDSVNELSCTMELVPLLTRAESLFRRFERMVQRIDKKDNFPMPGRPQAGESSQAARDSVGQHIARGIGAERDSKVITPELRQLLSRERISPRRSEH